MTTRTIDTGTDHLHAEVDDGVAVLRAEGFAPQQGFEEMNWLLADHVHDHVAVGTDHDVLHHPEVDDAGAELGVAHAREDAAHVVGAGGRGHRFGLGHRMLDRSGTTE
mgnify:CR=1 FL=1